MAQAYEDTRVLKEHVVSNDVSQEHIYALHVQVKRTATRVREASRNIDDLIAIALKQMTLNVNAVRDFGTVLRAIPAEAMGIQDFYRSIRSFYVGLLERLVKKYGPNQPFIINIAHSFEHFLQTCDFLEPLPGGYAQFTGMMASIIRDVYDIDMDELKSAAREMRSEMKAESSKQGEEDSEESLLSRSEIKAVMKEARLKTVREKEEKEMKYYESRAGRILEKIVGGAPISPEVQTTLAEAMKKDEWEMRPGKLKLKDQGGPSRK